MKPTLWATTFSGLSAAALLVIALSSHKAITTSASPKSATAITTTIANKTAHQPTVPSAPSHDGTGRRPSMGDRQRLKVSENYWALAHEFLPRANAGDAEAQYSLWAIFETCQHEGYSSVIHDDKGAVSLDEALQKATLWDLPQREVQRTYKRCHRFYETDIAELGEPRDWLQRATDGGYPLAQATTANLRLIQEQDKAFARAGAVPVGFAREPPIGGDIEPRRLLRIAVESKDPEVYSEVGALQYLLNPTVSPEERELNSLAWTYIACQSGFDCSGYGDLVSLGCSPSDTECLHVPEVLFDRANDNWAPVAERAREIQNKIKAQQWNELGLGAD